MQQQIDYFDLGMTLVKMQAGMYKTAKLLNICPECGRDLHNDVVCECALDYNYFANWGNDNENQ